MSTILSVEKVRSGRVFEHVLMQQVMDDMPEHTFLNFYRGSASFLWVPRGIEQSIYE